MSVPGRATTQFFSPGGYGGLYHLEYALYHLEYASPYASSSPSPPPPPPPPPPALQAHATAGRHILLDQENIAFSQKVHGSHGGGGEREGGGGGHGGVVQDSEVVRQQQSLLPQHSIRPGQQVILVASGRIH